MGLEKRSSVNLDSTAVQDYLRSEFLTMESIDKFSLVYGELYGDSARTYFHRTYRSWRSGAISMSGQTEYRLLVVMPKVLNDDKRFHVLSLYLDEAIESHCKAWRREEIKLSELSLHTQVCMEKITDNNYNFDWFVDSVYSQAELKAFSDLVCWSLIVYAQKTFEETFTNIETIAAALQSRVDAVRVTYRVKLFDAELIFDQPDIRPEPLLVPPVNFSFDGRLKAQFRRALIDRGLSIYDNNQRAVQLRDSFRRDIIFLLEQSKGMRAGVQYDYKLRSELPTSEVSIHLFRRSLTSLRLSLVGAIAALFTVVAVSVIGVAAMVTYRIETSAAICPGWILIILGGMIVPWLQEKWGDLKDYERERKNWPPTVRR